MVLPGISSILQTMMKMHGLDGYRQLFTALVKGLQQGRGISAATESNPVFPWRRQSGQAVKQVMAVEVGLFGLHFLVLKLTVAEQSAEAIFDELLCCFCFEFSQLFLKTIRDPFGDLGRFLMRSAQWFRDDLIYQSH
jgi:hypothetical protein